MPKPKKQPKSLCEKIPVESERGILFVTHRQKAQRILGTCPNVQANRYRGSVYSIWVKRGHPAPFRGVTEFLEDIDRFLFGVNTAVLRDTFSPAVKREFMRGHNLRTDWA